MEKESEKTQLKRLGSLMDDLESAAHKLRFDGNSFVLEDRIAGHLDLVDEFNLIDWLDEMLSPVQFEVKRRIGELK